jgi:hypothetical protein
VKRRVARRVRIEGEGFGDMLVVVCGCAIEYRCIAGMVCQVVVESF